ncbi:hypothetical protein [Actibacterium lipolyticum]|uniref:Uncharacterized protein n=1 Tax=Actibacterium lipolyticum TaxID=1524263 RepID=A0A238KS09_9RHOB|nr:hypothetical protein [Actibacterium lipolyticum]SMX45391.1 hypothetical protein COL8621_02784 [Actibacterium lipolyticum]
MPLSVLLPLVVIGIAGIAVLLHLLGYSRPATIRDAIHAKQLWLHHWPDDIVTDAKVCADGRAALVQTAKGTGLVWSFGADTSARLLTNAHAKRIKHGLRIRMPDFTAPAVKLRLPDAEAIEWMGEIERTTQ